VRYVLEGSVRRSGDQVRVNAQLIDAERPTRILWAGGRTRQFSLRREQVDDVRRWLGNYLKLKEALEDICELNHALLRPDGAAPRGAKKNP
jgi:hypothetical protein